MKYTFSLFLITLSLLSLSATAQLQIINTIAGTGAPGFSGDGSSAISAELYGPLSIAVDNSGNIFIADFYNWRIRKINTSGQINTIAGNGTQGNTGNGSLATSAEISPNNIAVDKAGNLYIADAGNNVIREVNKLGIISVVAGTGIAGYSGDNGAATSAALHTPCGIAIDTFGNLFIAEAGNNIIRKVNTKGTITTIAGTGVAGYVGDGGLAIGAELDSPYSVAADIYGNIYISDFKNNVIRKIDTIANITTYAGIYNSYGFTGGIATAAQLNGPRGIAVDTSGNLFIADAGNNVIRKVDISGNITTAAGNGDAGFGGDLGTVNGANLHNPYGVTVDNYGSIYIADANNQRIRKTYNGDLGVAPLLTRQSIDVYPNPSRDNIIVSGLEASYKIALYDITARQVGLMLTATRSTQQLSIKNLAAGVYVLQVWNDAGNKIAVTRVIKE